MDMGDIGQRFVVEGNVKNERKRSHRTLLAKLLLEFGSNTTLHGLRYVTDRRLSLVEKIFWLVTFLASIGICCYWIHSVWVKWRDSPIIVTFNERLEPVGSVPFPSITICPQLIVNATVFNYTDIYRNYYFNREANKNLSAETKRIFEHVSLPCKEYTVTDILNNDHTNASLVDDMLKVAPKFPKLVYDCIWNKDEFTDCKSLFKMVITEEGICYNMNSLPIYDILRKESIQQEYEYMTINPEENIRGWTEHGYYDPNEKYPYPRRAQNNGLRTELEIVFYVANKYQDEICNRIDNGFKVFVHQPQDMPRSSMHYYSVNPNMNSLFALSFNILNSSDNIRSVSPEIRQCYFPGERELRYFKIYSASNCELECLTNRTMELCNCVFFYMPYETSRKLCRGDGDSCMSLVGDSLDRDTCNCLPSCNTIEYEADVLKNDFKLSEYLKALKKFNDKGRNINELLAMDKLAENGQYSCLNVYYKRPRYISMRRSLLFGTTDFLSNCGGLLGLFLGFSFLSLVEIIYFISLRLYVALKKEAKQVKEEEKRPE